MTQLPKFDPSDEQKRQRTFSLTGAAEEIDLRELLRKLWRQRRIMLGTAAIITAVVAIITFQLTPMYTATGLVMIEPRQAQVVAIESVLSGLPPDTDTVNSEIEILQSRHLAERVVSRLKLEQDPEFNVKMREQTMWQSFTGWIAEMVGLGGGDEEMIPTLERDLTRDRAEVMTNFIKRLSVQSKARSRVIEISVESMDPEKAALLVNTIADLYLVDQLEAKYEATKRATEWLSQRLVELRQKVEVSEKAVEDYRQQSGLIKGKDDVSIASVQISELSSQLIIARSRRAESEARLQQVERLMKSSAGVGSVTEVLASGLIQTLRGQESAILRRAAELSAEFGPKHPQMIAVRAELSDLRKKIDSEVRKIISGLRSEVEVAKSQERTVEASLEALEKRVGDLNRKDVQLRALEREAQANRALLETILARFKETSAQEDIQNADARVISAADVPVRPSFPNKVLIIGGTFFAATVLGIFLVFVIEQLDYGFRSMEQVEQLTGIPALGLVPSIDAEMKGSTTPHQYVLDKPISAYAESMRNLHVSLSLSNVDKPPKAVLITSSVPEEGKTSVSLSLARMVARSGNKVVIIDCDLRRPSVHTRLQLPEKPGLVELLAHKADIKEVIKKDKPSGADVIAAGDHAPNPTDLLGSDQMKQLVAKLSAAYDLVVMDCSPVLAVTDSRVLTRIADKTVFVAQWEKTRRESAMLGLKQIRDAGGSLAGMLLTQVNVKKHSAYGYADSGYYHGKYQKYYTS